MPTIPSNEQTDGNKDKKKITERSSAQTNSAREIYTYAELMAGATGATELESGTGGIFAGVSKLGATYNMRAR